MVDEHASTLTAPSGRTGLLLLRINLILLILLSLSTGLVKLLRMQAEMDLFAKAGFGEQGVTALGLLQLMGGGMLFFAKYRRIGAAIMAASFILASAVVFIAGMIPFGFFSLLFVVMAVVAYRRPIGLVAQRASTSAVQ